MSRRTTRATSSTTATRQPASFAPSIRTCSACRRFRAASAPRGGCRASRGQRHAGAILAALADQPGALVVAGDLNELNDGAAHRAFAQGLRVVSGSVPTYPSRAPRKALDVIFATPHLKVVAGPPVVLDDAVLAAASKEEIGLLAGVSRQRVNRALQTLEQAGFLTTQYGGLTVLDLDALRRFGDRVPWERAGPAARSRARSRRCRRAATRWRGTAGRRRHREP